MVAERVDVPVLQDVEHSIDMLVSSDGRWASDTGGDVEYNEKSTASGSQPVDGAGSAVDLPQVRRRQSGGSSPA